MYVCMLTFVVIHLILTYPALSKLNSTAQQASHPQHYYAAHSRSGMDCRTGESRDLVLTIQQHFFFLAIHFYIPPWVESQRSFWVPYILHHRATS